MPIVISADAFALLHAEAERSPGREVCGILLGKENRIVAVVPTANVAADPATAFEIDPAALIAAHRAERAGGPGVLGCYHSHPSGSPRPSPRDAAAAEPGRLWIILGGGEARAWRATKGGFVEMPLVVS